jgi:hypothetical protein
MMKGGFLGQLVKQDTPCTRSGDLGDDVSSREPGYVLEILLILEYVPDVLVQVTQ